MKNHDIPRPAHCPAENCSVAFFNNGILKMHMKRCHLDIPNISNGITKEKQKSFAQNHTKSQNFPSAII